MYKFYYKWKHIETTKEGISEAIVGADSEQEAVQMLREENEGFAIDIVDSFQLQGRGVLVSSTRSDLHLKGVGESWKSVE